MIFTKFSIFFFIPMIVPMLLLGHNTKKNTVPSPQGWKPSQKCQKMPILEPISTIFCHFDGLHSAENLGGIALFFDMFLFKIWKNITFFPQESIELHVLTIFKPPQTHRNRPGVMKTQILPNICCQILHLCTSYSNKTGFTHCAMVKLKCQQFSTMVWPTSEPSTGPYTHYLFGFLSHFFPFIAVFSLTTSATLAKNCFTGCAR